jgi:hypothetical protein
VNLQAAYDLSLAESEHDYSSVRPRTGAPAQGDRDNKAEA